MKKIIIGFALVLSSVCAFAQSVNDAPSTESIDELMRLTKADKVLESVAPLIEGQMRAGIESSIGSKPMTADQKKFMESFVAKMVVVVKDELNWNNFKDINLQIHRETYTQGEVDGMIAFYKTPTGQAMIAKMPLMLQKTMGLMQQRMGPMIQKMQAAVAESIREAQATGKLPNS